MNSEENEKQLLKIPQFHFENEMLKKICLNYMREKVNTFQKKQLGITLLSVTKPTKSRNTPKLNAFGNSL